MSRTFVPFGAPHLIVMVLTASVPVALAIGTRLLRSANMARAVSFAFAGALIVTWTVWYWLIMKESWLAPHTILPMDLCDWATIAAIVTLVIPNQQTYELAYFWAFSGTLQAIVTPELYYDFPDVRFIIFFAFHGGTVAAVLFLTLARGLRPYPSSLPRVIAWSLLYLVLALAVNQVFGTNFGYLSAKPATPSLLDVMGPWPIYVVEVAGAGILYLLMLYAPFFIADRVKQRRGG